MEKNIQKAIETYQCPGCTNGCGIACFVKADDGVGCGKHSAGTFLSMVGKIFLGMPKGFNRLGNDNSMQPQIWNTFADNNQWLYDKFNVPTWKHLTKKGHTIVRGMSPRRNSTFIHIYLEDCLDKINCLEITHEDLKEMD